QRAEILGLYPWTKGLISLVCRMNREPIRSPARSVANLEFHHVGDHTNEVAGKIVSVLEAEGVRAVNPSMGFPMEVGRFPGKLCVAACPVGAIAPDGHFDFTACLTHNYREFLGGFTDWVEQVAESKDARDYRRRVEDAETVSMWQSLGFGPNYKAAYCMAACPAGDDVIGPFLADRKGFVAGVVEPLRAKQEPVYVIPGSDAEAYVSRRFPHKRPRRVGGGRRPRSIRSFLFALPHLFQRHASDGLDATYHFTFTGEEP